MVDDSYYITPHETALAVVATSMKKARLHLDTLIVNSLIGGILFSCGGLLFVAARSENPGIFESNPGVTSTLGALTFSIGLFYVVIMGADLFNSNVLFFSVGLLRGAVSIYDLLISWSISWIGNFAGTLFVAYVICHLSGATTSDLIIAGSKSIAEGKLSYSFIQTFIKGIAGNFYVCLAVYLQLMCKPIHVKYIVMTLPIFTFVALGFTHVVADMSMVLVGMLNGADFSIGKFIWKLMIPGTLGNMVGGSFFGAVVPYYLHLRVVERDRKQLSLPEYEARDEQPELNMDSRVVRVAPTEVKETEGSDSDEEGSGQLSEKQSSNESEFNGSQVQPYYANEEPGSVDLSRTHTMNTLSTVKSHSSKIRSPPGVFPVRGMGKPLARERTIVDSEYSHPSEPSMKRSSSLTNSFDMISVNSDVDSTLQNPLQFQDVHSEEPSSIKRTHTLRQTLSHVPTSTVLHPLKTHEDPAYQKEVEEYEREGHYNVRDHTLGTKLEKALSRIATHKPDDSDTEMLPRTTQDVFPEQRQTSDLNLMERTRSASSMKGLFKTFSKQFLPTKPATDVDEIHRRLSQAGITSKAAHASDNIAGIDNYDGIELPKSNSPFYNRRPSSTSASSTHSLNTMTSQGRSIQSQGNGNKASGNMMSGGGSLSVAGKRQSNPIKNLVHFDNDNFEEQSIMDAR